MIGHRILDLEETLEASSLVIFKVSFFYPSNKVP